jgi:hypothetical protein
MAEMVGSVARTDDKSVADINHTQRQAQPQQYQDIDMMAESQIISGKRSKSGIVLRPQPTNDPNEPLVCSLPPPNQSISFDGH